MNHDELEAMRHELERYREREREDLYKRLDALDEKQDELLGLVRQEMLNHEQRLTKLEAAQAARAKASAAIGGGVGGGIVGLVEFVRFFLS